jgi:DNA mismatch repair protein MutS2
MAFKKGDRVLILSLKKAGRIADVRKPGLYQVLIGVIQVECREKDLKIAGPYEDDDDLPKYVSPRPSKGSGNSKSRTSHSIDLHGYTGAEATRATEEAVNAALLAHCDSLRIVHGLGSGRVKTVVHGTLAKLSVVKKFHLDPGNSGVTLVYF